MCSAYIMTKSLKPCLLSIQYKSFVSTAKTDYLFFDKVFKYLFSLPHLLWAVAPVLNQISSAIEILIVDLRKFELVSRTFFHFFAF